MDAAESMVRTRIFFRENNVLNELSQRVSLPLAKAVWGSMVTFH